MNITPIVEEESEAKKSIHGDAEQFSFDKELWQQQSIDKHKAQGFQVYQSSLEEAKLLLGFLGFSTRLIEKLVVVSLVDKPSHPKS